MCLCWWWQVLQVAYYFLVPGGWQITGLLPGLADPCWLWQIRSDSRLTTSVPSSDSHHRNKYCTPLRRAKSHSWAESKMDTFCYFCTESNFFSRGPFTPTKLRHFFYTVSGTPKIPICSLEFPLNLWWPSGCDSVISGRCCGYPRVLSFTLTIYLPYWIETIHGTTIFFSTCKSSSNGDFHKSASINAEKEKEKWNPKWLGTFLFATVWYSGISCWEAHAKLLLFFFFLSDTFATNPDLLSVWDANMKLTQSHWDLPDFMSELDLLLANVRLQLIQTHSEAKQMLLWASSMFKNRNEAWNQVLSVLSWMMDFILLVKTQLTHLLVYHFWSWYGVKYQVVPDKWLWDSRNCSLL